MTFRAYSRLIKRCFILSEGILTPVASAVKKGSRPGFSAVSAAISFLILAAVSFLSLFVGMISALLLLLTFIAEIGISAAAKKHTPKYKTAAVFSLLTFAVSSAVSVLIFVAPPVFEKFIFSLTEFISPLEKFFADMTVFDILPLTVILALKELIDFIYCARIINHLKKNTPFGVLFCIILYGVLLLFPAALFFIGPFKSLGGSLVYIILFTLLGLSIIFKFIGAVVMQSNLRKAKYVFTKEK